jgi:hypothetical protein
MPDDVYSGRRIHPWVVGAPGATLTVVCDLDWAKAGRNTMHRTRLESAK